MTRRRAPEAAAAPPWWIEPSNVALAVVLPLLIASLLVSQGFQRYFDRPQKFMSAEYFIVGLLAVAALAAGAYVGSRVAVRRRPAPASPRVLIAQHRQRIVIASRLILALAGCGNRRLLRVFRPGQSVGDAGAAWLRGARRRSRPGLRGPGAPGLADCAPQAGAASSLGRRTRL